MHHSANLPYSAAQPIGQETCHVGVFGFPQQFSCPLCLLEGTLSDDAVLSELTEYIRRELPGYQAIIRVDRV